MDINSVEVHPRLSHNQSHNPSHNRHPVDGDWWVLHRIQGEKKVQQAQPKVEIFKNPKSSKVGGGKK